MNKVRFIETMAKTAVILLVAAFVSIISFLISLAIGIYSISVFFAIMTGVLHLMFTIVLLIQIKKEEKVNDNIPYDQAINKIFCKPVAWIILKIY